jgi:Fic family protein
MNTGAGLTKAERKSGTYRYYIPTPLVQLDLSLQSDVVADIARAEKAIQTLDIEVKHLKTIDGLSRFLTRAEAISSSYIEGLTLGARRLMLAELGEAEHTGARLDRTAAEIVGNIKALGTVLDEEATARDVTVKTFTNIHQALYAQVPRCDFAGLIRQQQNWIGGNSFNPFGAAHVPPAPEYVPELLEDLAAYCNQTQVSPIQQAALAHAQFEAIHPFIDGNGRTGRALIQLILRRRGLGSRVVPPISLVLSTFVSSYVAGLNSLRFEGPQPSAEAMERINEWVSFFAGACVRAASDVWQYEAKARALEAGWRKKLDRVRTNSALDLLLDRLIGMPVFSVNTAAANIDRSFEATNQAVARLAAAGIIKPVRAQKRKRVFEVPQALDLLRALERQLASKTGDTRTG